MSIIKNAERKNMVCAHEAEPEDVMIRIRRGDSPDEYRFAYDYNDVIRELVEELDHMPAHTVIEAAPVTLEEFVRTKWKMTVPEFVNSCAPPSRDEFLDDMKLIVQACARAIRNSDDPDERLLAGEMLLRVGAAI